MVLSDNITKYCQQNKISLARFEKMCGIGNGVVAKWGETTSGPRITSLIKIQEATGIPAGKWLDENGLD